MRIVFVVFVLILSTFALSCQKSQAVESSISHYEVNKPNKIWELPEILTEISGLTILDKKTVACVQDEKGIAFIYDLAKGSIEKELSFGSDGDYEDIVSVGARLYILRSDGTLIEFAGFNSKSPKSIEYETNILAKDNEGLLYDKSKNRLLIGTKSKIEKNVKGIFAFDLETKKLDISPIYTFNTKELTPGVQAKGIKIKTKKGKLKFKLSAIAINPKNKNLYVLSASEYLIFVFNNSGKLLEVANLNQDLYKKAEGLTFYDNGDMLISSEGDGGKAKIMLIKYGGE